MANEPTPVPQQSTPPPVVPTQGVSNFMVLGTFTEFLVTVGQPRVIANPPPATPTIGVEWIMTLSISPPAAKQLVKALAGGIEQYEKLNGTIPDAPVVTPAPSTKS
jgi:hypothetical protein